MIFEIYTKEIEIESGNGSKIKLQLRPLSGRFLPKLFSIAGKFSADEKDNMKIFSDEKAILDLHEITKETLRKSYPMEKEEVLDEFASQNLFKLLEGIIEVNMGKQK